MKILVANPNTSAGVTDRLIASGRLVAGPGTELIPMTATRGVPFIASRAEAAIGGAVLLEMLAARREKVDAARPDAAIVAAFGDPALGAARELFDFPVVGMAEAAMLMACTLGRSFAIVSFSRSLEPWFTEIVDSYGMSSRCAGIHMMDESFQSLDEIQDEKEAVLAELANRAVTMDKADVVILAGAPLSGLGNRIRDRVPVPLVDGIQAAVVMAEGLARLKPRKAIAGSFRRPPPKELNGLAGPLADLIRRKDG